MSLYYETSAGQIFCGDALDVLKSMDSCSVQCCITSPPYFGLRDYSICGCSIQRFYSESMRTYGGADREMGNGGNMSSNDKRCQKEPDPNCEKCNGTGKLISMSSQLGIEPTLQEFIAKLCNIFDEVKRVLRDDGICFVVIGDTYSSKPVGTFNGGGKEFIGRNMDGIKTSGNNDKTKSGVQEKCLLQIPSRFAIEMTNRGWILRNEIIWHKKNAMPSSASDRFTVDFEKVFFFSKNKQYKFNQQLEPYQHPINRWGGTLVKRLNGADEYGMAQRIRDYRPVKDGKNKRCVWSINTKPFSEAHFAVYPEALIEPCILAGTDKGDIILDPFFGAGTTGVAAYKHNRKFVGIELNSEYVEIAAKRIETEASQLKLFR